MISDEKKDIHNKRSRELLDLLNDVDELDWLEAKSLRDDTSRSILETVCSFSNEPGLGGGVILIGVAESKNADGPRYVVDGPTFHVRVQKAWISWETGRRSSLHFCFLRCGVA